MTLKINKSDKIRVTRLITGKSNDPIKEKQVLQSTAAKNFSIIVNRQDSDQMFSFLCMCLNLHEIGRTIFV